jgi:hypothetical protein
MMITNYSQNDLEEEDNETGLDSRKVNGRLPTSIRDTSLYCMCMIGAILRWSEEHLTTKVIQCVKRV